MPLTSLKELLGRDVLVRGARIGRLRDVCIDRDSGLVRYVVVATAPRTHLVVSTGLAQHASAGGVQLALSSAQLECGAGAWPLEGANTWLQHQRLCRGAEVLGYRAEARDGSAGRVLDMLIDEEEWSIDYVIIDSLSEGSGRKLLVSLHWVAAFDVARGALRLRRTRAELAESPAP